MNAIMGSLLLVCAQLPQAVLPVGVDPSDCREKPPDEILSLFEVFWQSLKQAISQELPCVFNRIEILRTFRIAIDKSNATLPKRLHSNLRPQAFLEVLHNMRASQAPIVEVVINQL